MIGRAIGRYQWRSRGGHVMRCRATPRCPEREICDGHHIADDRGLVAFNGIGTRAGGNTRLAAGVLAFLVSGSSAHASMTLSSWQPAQKAVATTTSTATTTGTATTPSEVAPG